MKNLLLLVSYLYLFLTFAKSQDLIVKRDGKEIESKVEIIGQTTIQYKNFSNIEGPSYIVDKADVKNISFENGSIQTFETYSPVKKLSKLELQDSIVTLINKHGYERRTYDQRYSASFDGDYLKLTILKKNGKPTDNTISYDFSKVHEFQNISKRTDKLAFINIHVATSVSDKYKLIMRVDNSEIAIEIVELLKDYNALLNHNP